MGPLRLSFYQPPNGPTPLIVDGVGCGRTGAVAVGIGGMVGDGMSSCHRRLGPSAGLARMIALAVAIEHCLGRRSQQDA